MAIFLLLAIVCAAIVFGIAREIIQQRRCLTEEEFKAFQGRSFRGSDEKNRRAISHLGICKKCQRKLEEMNFGRNTEDHLVE